MSMSVQLLQVHKVAKVHKMANRDYAWLMISRSSKITFMSRQRNKLKSLKSKITTTIHKLMIEVKDYELKTKVEANMNPIVTQQVALDNALVAPAKRLKIKRCNTRIEFSKPQKEETYQVSLDALKLSPCYPAFQITAEVPEIYMH
ncbi:hypothetical protein Tco_1240339 [Tanacetum coccineum]